MATQPGSTVAALPRPSPRWEELWADLVSFRDRRGVPFGMMGSAVGPSGSTLGSIGARSSSLSRPPLSLTLRSASAPLPSSSLSLGRTTPTAYPALASPGRLHWDDDGTQHTRRGRSAGGGGGAASSVLESVRRGCTADAVRAALVAEEQAAALGAGAGAGAVVKAGERRAEVDDDGRTALHVECAAATATENKGGPEPDVVAVLLEAYPDAAVARDGRGMTPLETLLESLRSSPSSASAASSSRPEGVSKAASLTAMTDVGHGRERISSVVGMLLRAEMMLNNNNDGSNSSSDPVAAVAPQSNALRGPALLRLACRAGPSLPPDVFTLLLRTFPGAASLAPPPSPVATAGAAASHTSADLGGGSGTHDTHLHAAIRCGSPAPVVRALVQACPEAGLARDGGGGGRTPLSIALARNCEQKVGDVGAGNSARDETMIVSDDVILTLIASCPQCASILEPDGRTTPLVQALLTGRPASVVRELLRADPSSAGASSFAAASAVASSFVTSSTVGDTVMRGPDGIASKPPPPGETAATSTTAYTPLRIAAEISPEEVVMAVLEACPSAASVPDIKGEHPLLTAALRSQRRSERSKISVARTPRARSAPAGGNNLGDLERLFGGGYSTSAERSLAALAKLRSSRTKSDDMAARVARAIPAGGGAAPLSARAVTALLAAYPPAAACTDARGMTPLLVACEDRQYDVVLAMVELCPESAAVRRRTVQPPPPPPAAAAGDAKASASGAGSAAAGASHYGSGVWGTPPRRYAALASERRKATAAATAAEAARIKAASAVGCSSALWTVLSRPRSGWVRRERSNEVEVGAAAAAGGGGGGGGGGAADPIVIDDDDAIIGDVNAGPAQAGGAAAAAPAGGQNAAQGGGGGATTTTTTTIGGGTSTTTSSTINLSEDDRPPLEVVRALAAADPTQVLEVDASGQTVLHRIVLALARNGGGRNRAPEQQGDAAGNGAGNAAGGGGNAAGGGGIAAEIEGVAAAAHNFAAQIQAMHEMAVAAIEQHEHAMDAIQQHVFEGADAGGEAAADDNQDNANAADPVDNEGMASSSGSSDDLTYDDLIVRALLQTCPQAASAKCSRHGRTALHAAAIHGAGSRMTALSAGGGGNGSVSNGTRLISSTLLRSFLEAGGPSQLFEKDESGKTPAFHLYRTLNGMVMRGLGRRKLIPDLSDYVPPELVPAEDDQDDDGDLKPAVQAVANAAAMNAEAATNDDGDDGSQASADPAAAERRDPDRLGLGYGPDALAEIGAVANLMLRAELRPEEILLYNEPTGIGGEIVDDHDAAGSSFDRFGNGGGAAARAASSPRRMGRPKRGDDDSDEEFYDASESFQEQPLRHRPWNMVSAAVRSLHCPDSIIALALRVNPRDAFGDPYMVHCLAACGPNNIGPTALAAASGANGGGDEGGGDQDQVDPRLEYFRCDRCGALDDGDAPSTSTANANANANAPANIDNGNNANEDGAEAAGGGGNNNGAGTGAGAAANREQHVHIRRYGLLGAAAAVHIAADEVVGGGGGVQPDPADGGDDGDNNGGNENNAAAPGPGAGGDGGGDPNNAPPNAAAGDNNAAVNELIVAIGGGPGGNNNNVNHDEPPGGEIQALLHAHHAHHLHHLQMQAHMQGAALAHNLLGQQEQQHHHHHLHAHHHHIAQILQLQHIGQTRQTTNQHRILCGRCFYRGGMHSVADYEFSRHGVSSSVHTALLKEILRLAPSLASVVDPERGYRVPLNIALEAGRTWYDGVREIFDASPEVLSRRDPGSSLFPFMVSAAASFVEPVEASAAASASETGGNPQEDGEGGEGNFAAAGAGETGSPAARSTKKPRLEESSPVAAANNEETSAGDSSGRRGQRDRRSLLHRRMLRRLAGADAVNTAARLETGGGGGTGMSRRSARRSTSASRREREASRQLTTVFNLLTLDPTLVKGGTSAGKKEG